MIDTKYLEDPYFSQVGGFNYKQVWFRVVYNSLEIIRSGVAFTELFADKKELDHILLFDKWLYEEQDD